jgi:hypothetical protein
MIRPTFEDAKLNSTLRQAYLDSIQFTMPKYIHRLVYDDPNCAYSSEVINSFFRQGLVTEENRDYRIKEIQKLNTFAIACAMFVPKLIGTRESTDVVVYDAGFHVVPDEHSFLHIMIEHEGYHCKDRYYGVEVSGFRIDQSTVQSFKDAVLAQILELRAFRNELDAYRKKMPHLRRERIMADIEQCKEFLSTQTPISDLERKAILASI